MAFLDIAPVNKGHVLVVPKIHSDDFLSTDDEIIEKVFKISKRIGDAVMTATEAKGINFSINNGAAAGQIIFHLHIHIIPRFNNDGFEPWAKTSYQEGEMKEYAEKIKNTLKNN